MKKSAALPNLFRRMLDNPIVIKELRGRMRGRRAFVVLTIYLLIIGLLTVGIYQLIVAQSYNQGSWDPQFRQNTGKAIFGSVIGFEFLLIGFIGPALTAGAITGERERQTLDLLRTTLLSPRTLVFGKLSTACAYLLLLVLAATPIEALAFIFGGVGLEELFVSSLLLLVNIFFFCALGILCSSIARRTLTSTIASYSIILISVIITVGILYGLIQISNDMYNSGYQDLYGVIIWFFCTTNTPLTAILSESALMLNHLFVYGPSLVTPNISLLSPWVMHVPLAAITATIMILISNLLVNRPER